MTGKAFKKVLDEFVFDFAMPKNTDYYSDRLRALPFLLSYIQKLSPLEQVSFKRFLLNELKYNKYKERWWASKILEKWDGCHLIPDIYDIFKYVYRRDKLMKKVQNIMRDFYSQLRCDESTLIFSLLMKLRDTTPEHSRTYHLYVCKFLYHDFEKYFYTLVLYFNVNEKFATSIFAIFYAKSLAEYPPLFQWNDCRVGSVYDYFIHNNFSNMRYLIEQTRAKNSHAGTTLKYMMKAHARLIPETTTSSKILKNKLLEELESW
jgi:hypothetical protein